MILRSHVIHTEHLNQSLFLSIFWVIIEIRGVSFGFVYSLRGGGGSYELLPPLFRTDSPFFKNIFNIYFRLNKREPVLPDLADPA